MSHRTFLYTKDSLLKMKTLTYVKILPWKYFTFTFSGKEEVITD